MAPDDLQQAWQAHSPQMRVKIYDELMLKELQRDLRRRQIVPFWISCILLGTAVLMLFAYWNYAPPQLAFPWYYDPFYWIIGWLFASSLLGLRRSLSQGSDIPESLLDCLKRSLNHVDRELAWTRRSWKWMLLATVLSCAFFYLIGGATAFPVMATTVLIMAFDYFVIQFVGRVSSDFQRQKLLPLYSSLTDEPYRSQELIVSTSDSKLEWLMPFVFSVAGAAAILLVWSGEFVNSQYTGLPKGNVDAAVPLMELVSHQRKEKNLVGLAAMVMVDGEVQATVADGERKKGSQIPIDLTDSWHLGGVAKSITATMIARLVESGRMQWSDTVSKVFPNAPMHAEWKSATLKQLLTDTAGAPTNFSYAVRLKNPPLGPECTQQRQEAVFEVLAEKPVDPPGTKFAYSNVGCSIAAAMAEAVTETGWDELVKKEVFSPLGLTEAGFGPPRSSATTVEQPVGHRMIHGRKYSANDQADNTTIMAPSGAVHMTLKQLCEYATEHLRGERGEGKLLPPDVYRELHTPELDQYASGWIERSATYDIPCRMLWHNGSNTMWYALVVLIPEKNMVVAVTSNDGDSTQADIAAWKVVEACSNLFKTENDQARRKELPSSAFPKKSPFESVRWNNQTPEVRIAQEWTQLVSLDGIAADKIVSFCQNQFGDLWQKRFEEDLFEVLFLMGHEAKETVKLVVRSSDPVSEKTLSEVRMTEANRLKIREERKRREIGRRAI